MKETTNFQRLNNKTAKTITVLRGAQHLTTITARIVRKLYWAILCSVLNA